MSPHRLYQHRWKENLRFQYQVWKSVVDWTIALYILIPALLIFFKTYIGWWNSEPDWFANVSLPIFIGFTYIFVGGAIPLYIKPADQLFLFQKKEWMQSYIQIGLHYAWWKQGVQSLLFTLLLWPLFNYIVDMDLFLFIGFWIYLWQAKMFGSLIQRRITILNRWIYKILWGVSLRVLGGCAFILIGVQGIKSPSVFVLASLIVGGCSVALAGRIKQTNTFLKDIEYDEIQRLKWVSLILGQTGYASPKYWVKKSPWIFPQSNTLFRERSSSHVMAESIMKSFLRNGRQLWSYSQFIILCTIAIMISPILLKWILWFFLSILFTLWGRMFCREYMKNPASRVWIHSISAVKPIFEKSVLFIHLIGFIPLTIGMGLSMFGLVGMVMFPLALPVSFLTVKLMST